MERTVTCDSCGWAGARLGPALLVALLVTAPVTPLCAQDVRLTGAEVDVALVDGGDLRGELIEAVDGSLLLLSESGYASVALDEVAQIEWRRHEFDSGDAMLWVGIGSLVTLAGMSYACSQYEGGDCSGAVAATVIPWAVLGVPFALWLGGSAWGDLPADELELRAYARFPQGAPESFRSRRDANRPPGG